MSQITYPNSNRGNQIHIYHGTPIPDPYEWLEDCDSPDTKTWIEAQNALTFAYLEKIPARQKIQRRLTELWNYPRAQAPHKRGGRYFQLRNSGLQNQDVLFVLETLD